MSKPRKVRTWVVVLVSVGVLVAGGFLFGAIRLYLGIKHVTDIKAEVNRTTDAYLEGSRDGLSQSEFDALCASSKEEFTVVDFAKPGPAITAHRITGTDVDYARGQATVTVEVEHADRGGSSLETYILAEESERWRMCAFPPV